VGFRLTNEANALAKFSVILVVAISIPEKSFSFVEKKDGDGRHVFRDLKVAVK